MLLHDFYDPMSNKNYNMIIFIIIICQWSIPKYDHVVDTITDIVHLYINFYFFCTILCSTSIRFLIKNVIFNLLYYAFPYFWYNSIVNVRNQNFHIFIIILLYDFVTQFIYKYIYMYIYNTYIYCVQKIF